jgi:hypothetical protein
MWLAQFVCAPQFLKTPKGLCGHTVYLFIKKKHESLLIITLFVELKFIYIYRTMLQLTSQVFCIVYHLQMAEPAEKFCNKYLRSSGILSSVEW